MIKIVAECQGDEVAAAKVETPHAEFRIEFRFLRGFRFRACSQDVGFSLGVGFTLGWEKRPQRCEADLGLEV